MDYKQPQKILRTAKTLSGSILLGLFFVVLLPPPLAAEQTEFIYGFTGGKWHSEYLQRYKQDMKSAYPMADTDLYHESSAEGKHGQIRYMSSGGSFSIYGDFLSINTVREVDTYSYDNIFELTDPGRINIVFNDHEAKHHSASAAIAYYPYSFVFGIGVGYRGMRQSISGVDRGGNDLVFVDPNSSQNGYTFINEYEEKTTTQGGMLDIHLNMKLHPRLEWRNTLSGFSMKGKYTRKDTAIYFPDANLMELAVEPSDSRTPLSELQKIHLQSGTPHDIEVKRVGAEYRSEFVYRITYKTDLHVGFSYMGSKVETYKLKQQYNWIVREEGLIPVKTQDIPGQAKGYFLSRLSARDHSHRDDIGRVFIAAGFKLGDNEQFRYYEKPRPTYESLPYSVDPATVEKQRQEREAEKEKQKQSDKENRQKQLRLKEGELLLEKQKQVNDFYLRKRERLLERHRELLDRQERLLEQNKQLMEKSRRIKKQLDRLEKNESEEEESFGSNQPDDAPKGVLPAPNKESPEKAKQPEDRAFPQPGNPSYWPAPPEI